MCVEYITYTILLQLPFSSNLGKGDCRSIKYNLSYVRDTPKPHSCAHNFALKWQPVCRKCEWEYIVRDCISICTNNSVCCFVHLHFKLARNILLLCLWRLYVSSSQQMFTISFKVLVFKLTLLYCYVCIGMITPHVALVSALSIAVGQKIIFVQCAEKRVPESAISSTLQHPNTPPSVLV